MRTILSTVAFVLVALCVCAQTFEVASIRKSPEKGKGKGRTGGPGTTSPDQIAWRRRPLGLLVLEAYDVPDSRFRAPSRIMPPDAALWDVQATLPANAKNEDVPRMLQALLTERFGLKVHWITEERAIYRMTAAKGGVKVKLGATNDSVGYATSDTAGLHAVGFSMRDVARLAERSLGEPGAIVQDDTGLTGVFTADLTYSPDDFKPALEQDWGLRLERGKGNVQVLVVDEIRDQPTAN